MSKDQKALPGMENRGIPELDEACREYVKIRDKRQDLTKREVEAKADLLAKMKKHKKREYVFRRHRGADRGRAGIDQG